MLGNGRIEAKCQDGETRLGQIRGQMRKKVRRCFILCHCTQTISPLSDHGTAPVFFPWAYSPSGSRRVLADARRLQVWIVAGDIVLLSLRDFQDDRADVIHKYTADEARNLKTYGELKNDFTIHETAQGEGGKSSFLLVYGNAGLLGSLLRIPSSEAWLIHDGSRGERRRRGRRRVPGGGHRRDLCATRFAQSHR